MKSLIAFACIVCACLFLWRSIPSITSRGVSTELAGHSTALDTAGEGHKGYAPLDAEVSADAPRRPVGTADDTTVPQAAPPAISSPQVELISVHGTGDDRRRVAHLRDEKGQLHVVELVPAPPPIAEGALPSNSTLDGDFLTVLHENGAVAEAGEFRDGAKQGEWSYWSASGPLVMEGSYVSGMAEGLWRQWHENGTMTALVTTAEGQYDGQCNFWSADGTPDMTRTGWYEKGQKVR